MGEATLSIFSIRSIHAIFRRAKRCQEPRAGPPIWSSCLSLSRPAFQRFQSALWPKGKQTWSLQLADSSLLQLTWQPLACQGVTKVPCWDLKHRHVLVDDVPTQQPWKLRCVSQQLNLHACLLRMHQVPNKKINVQAQLYEGLGVIYCGSCCQVS